MDYRTHKRREARAARDASLEAIAREVLGVETLADRGRDRLDFHDLHVSSLRRALEAAFDLGAADEVKR